MPALTVTETGMFILVGLALLPHADGGAVFPANQQDEAETLAADGLLDAQDTPKGRVYRITAKGRQTVTDYGYMKSRLAFTEVALIALVMGWVLSVLLGGTQ